MDIEVIIPTFKRIQNIEKCYKNVVEAGGIPLFVVNVCDFYSLVEVKRIGAKYTMDTNKPSGVSASNIGYYAVKSDWFILSQDDILFTKDSIKNAINHIKDEIKVIGLYDGFPENEQKEHSVSWLINRKYVEENSLSIGHRDVLFNPDYKKNYADNELNDTAKFRGVWEYAKDSLAEHIHPRFKKTVIDETYLINENFLQQDRQLFNSRRYLWTKN